MIPDEQALADETTPMLDAAYSTIDKLLKKLENDEVADLAAWRNDTLRPALADGARNLKQLIGMQLTAANMDLDNANKDYQLAQRNGVVLLSVGALLAILFAWFIIRGAMRRLGADPREAAEVARRIASGDLQFEMEAGRHDDVSLMGALRQMKASLLHSKLDYEGQINAIAKVQGVIECTPDRRSDQCQRDLPEADGLLAGRRARQELLDVRRRAVRGTDELPGFLAGAGARREPPG